MNIVGDAGMFAPLFPDDFLEEIIGRIPVAWGRIPKPVNEKLETRITKLLRHQYAYDSVIKQLPFQIRRELPIDDPKTGKELGRIDLCLLHGNDESVYFAFECNRLNVTFPSGKFASLAGEYVGPEGMGCFFSGQYSSGHKCAGMIGYVFDNDVVEIQKSIAVLMKQKRTELAMELGTLATCSLFPDATEIRESQHTLWSSEFTLFHIFLAMA